jgi:microcystin-dependent protein
MGLFVNGGWRLLAQGDGSTKINGPLYVSDSNNKNRIQTNGWGAQIGMNNNQWLFHTPGDGRTTMYIAPIDDGGNPIWGVNTNMDRSGTLTVNGSVNVGGRINGNGSVPAGTIVMYNSSSPPAGWVLCDGANGTPDLRGRFILGAGQGVGLTNRNQWEKGGEETVALQTSQIPGHTHGYADAFIVENWNWYNDQIGWNRNHINWKDEQSNGIKGSGDGDWDNSPMGKWRTTDAGTGGGQAHNNMPPYYVLTFIMKT